MDQLGLEMLYPNDTDQSPLAIRCKTGCFETGNGAGVIVRNNGTVQDEWSTRGALPWWDVTPPTWGSAPLSLGAMESLPASLLGEGSIPMAFAGFSKHANTVVRGNGQVDVNDSVWTAIAMSSVF